MQKLRGMFQMLEENHKMDRTNVASPPRLNLFIEMLGDKKELELSDGVINLFLEFEYF